MNEHGMESSKGRFLVYEAPDGELKLDVRLEEESVWLSQRQMAELFGCSTDNISLHLKNIYAEGELDLSSTTEDFSAVRLDQFLTMTGRELLDHAGTVSHEKAMQKAEVEFEKFRQQKLSEPTLAERHFVEMEEEVKKIESKGSE
jgi:hypothetical protein